MDNKKPRSRKALGQDPFDGMDMAWMDNDEEESSPEPNQEEVRNVPDEPMGKPASEPLISEPAFPVQAEISRKSDDKDDAKDTTGLDLTDITPPTEGETEIESEMEVDKTDIAELPIGYEPMTALNETAEKEPIYSLQELVTQIDRETGHEESPKPSDASAYGDLQYIRFFLDEMLLGIPLSSGLEIGHLPDITCLPNVPGWVLGISNVRGEIVSIVDLKAFFGLASAEPKRNARYIIVHNKSIKLGIMVDRVLGILSLDPADAVVQDSPFEEGEISGFVQGVIVSEDQPLYVLDIEKLLSSPRMSAIRAD